MQITVEESKEADTTTKEATHRISRGIHDKVDKSLLCQSCIWLIKIILNSPVHTGLCTEHIFDLSIDNGSKNAKKTSIWSSIIIFSLYLQIKEPSIWCSIAIFSLYFVGTFPDKETEFGWEG